MLRQCGNARVDTADVASGKQLCRAVECVEKLGRLDDDARQDCTLNVVKVFRKASADEVDVVVCQYSRISCIALINPINKLVLRSM